MYNNHMQNQNSGRSSLTTFLDFNSRMYLAVAFKLVVSPLEQLYVFLRHDTRCLSVAFLAFSQVTVYISAIKFHLKRSEQSRGLLICSMRPAEILA